MTDVRAEIRKGMERAFFAYGWADQRDVAELDASESGVLAAEVFRYKYGSLMETNITDVMPEEIDPAAIRQAAQLIKDLEVTNNTRVEAIYEKYPGPGTPELWGHYMAMQAMGLGVGLSLDYDVPEEAIKLPFPALYESILDKEYFK